MEKAHCIIKSSFIVFDNKGIPTINKMIYKFDCESSIINRHNSIRKAKELIENDSSSYALSNLNGHMKT